MHGQLWLVEHMSKKGIFECPQAVANRWQKASFIRIAGCHPALIAFMIGVSAS